ncbi:hypothetical protein AD006_29000 (plasmid) [Pseudonocardia sp. EC080610-09]|nr:hypothetical protein AD006_29000 [Pseudonocardia sp. EC080610-09]ALL85310.1 hypothetical protein AD017_29390 [Pseudonocardia sp. EC080619-01]
MTVDGIEGPVTIPTTPSRVVSVGNYRDTDAAVALGVVPLLPPDLGRFIQGGISPWVLAAVPGDPPDLIQVAARPESLATLDADVLILTFNSPEARTRLEADEMFQRIPAVQRGSYVALDLTTAIAIGFPSALSIPYALDQSLPQIAAALGA